MLCGLLDMKTNKQLKNQVSLIFFYHVQEQALKNPERK